MNTTDPRSPGFVYIMYATSWEAKLGTAVYKIGLSIHPEIRHQEIQKGLAPFIKVELILTLPVSNMYDVEQKIHALFDDKRLHNEWFTLYDREIDAIRNIAGQVSEIVRPRQRRAMADIKFGISSDMLSPDPDTIVKTTELESLILAYIKHSRRQLNNKLKALLMQSVIVMGSTYDSPDALYHKDPQFKVWVERKLADLAKLPGMNADRAVYSIRDYGNPKYGWVKVPENPVLRRVEETDTFEIPYGE